MQLMPRQKCERWWTPGRRLGRMLKGLATANHLHNTTTALNSRVLVDVIFAAYDAYTITVEASQDLEKNGQLGRRTGKMVLSVAGGWAGSYVGYIVGIWVEKNWSSGDVKAWLYCMKDVWVVDYIDALFGRGIGRMICDIISSPGFCICGIMGSLMGGFLGSVLMEYLFDIFLERNISSSKARKKLKYVKK